MAPRILPALYFVVVYSPLVALVSTAGAGWAWPAPRLWRLLAESVSSSAVVALAGALASFPVATRLWRRAWPRREIVVTLAFCLLPLPAYLHALAWNRLLTGSVGFSGGWIAAVWSQAMTLLPLGVLMALSALEAIPPELVEAARLLRSDAGVFRRVILPLALPALWATSGILFLLSVIDYTVFSLFSQPSYSLGIHSEFSAGAGAGSVLGASLPLMCLCALMLAAVSGRLRRAALASAPGYRKQEASFQAPRWWEACETAAMGVALCQILVPFWALASSLRSPAHVAGTVAAASADLAFSLALALLVVALGLPIALGTARLLVRPGRAASLWWFVALAPAAAPAPLAGIGLIVLWNRPLLGWAYGTSLMPVLACMARLLPLAVLVLAMRLHRIEPLLEEAARLFQPGVLAGWLRVRLPLVAGGLVAAASLLFAFTLSELGSTLLVAPPGRQTVTLRIYNYLHYGDSQAVTGLCLLTALLAVGAGYLAAAAWRQRA